MPLTDSAGHTLSTDEPLAAAPQSPEPGTADRCMKGHMHAKGLLSPDMQPVIASQSAVLTAYPSVHN